MTVQNLASVTGGRVEIDLCFGCRGIWFAPPENLKLAPSAMINQLEMLNAHRHDTVSPLANKLDCVRCGRFLVQGFDGTLAVGLRVFGWVSRWNHPGIGCWVKACDECQRHPASDRLASAFAPA